MEGGIESEFAKFKNVLIFYELGLAANSQEKNGRVEAISKYGNWIPLLLLLLLLPPLLLI